MYERAAKGLIDDEMEQALEKMLCANPKAGATVAGTGGVRKIRIARPGMGKRGGARVIYFYVGAKGRIYLITAYQKNTQENLTATEKAVIQQLTATLAKEQ